MNELSIKKNLLHLGQLLNQLNYQFTTVTPATHQHIYSRSEDKIESLTKDQILREFFGWNRALPLNVLPEEFQYLISKPELVYVEQGRIKSKFRVARLGTLLFFHSSYPTTQKHSVFFGPDTYRFANFLRTNFKPVESVLDVGCGSGAGGIFYQSLQTQSSPHVLLSDINTEALKLAEVNCELNRAQRVTTIQSDLFQSIKDKVDRVIANPPFIIDPSGPAYRNGGDEYGLQFSLQLLEAFFDYAKPGASLLLYTGSCVVKGEDWFLKRARKYFSSAGTYSYTEIDPDIFGEQLAHDEYAEVERIAAVGLSITKK
jgi:methylase of polypeptide subunit release factors